MNSQAKKISPLEWYSIFGILVLVGLIYSPVITNSFNGDDFGHIQWLRFAIDQPELIWRNFHSSWLDLTTAKFYRPLISVFMVIDYLIWHTNAVGFHLTNVICHLTNTFLVWLILRTITIGLSTEKSIDHYIWCISSAALFGLYPLHCEAVSWIIGRVDVFVTLFFLLAFLCYLFWKQSNQQKWLFFSVLAFVCSLLCKEMAVILPGLIFIYQLILAPRNSYGSFLKTAISTVKCSAVFFLVLIAYILWRAYALGTLVGGYDSSLLPLDSWYVLFMMWKHSLWILFVPFNHALFEHSKSFTSLWLLLLSTSAILCAKAVLTDKSKRVLFLFLLGWLALCLLPIYKLFCLMEDLESSRLVYMATVPLSMLMCLGLSCGVYNDKKIAYWKLVVLALILSAAGAGLLVNNTAWIKAASASSAIVDQMNEISKTTGPNTLTYFVDLPDQINGAFVCRNAMDGITKYPLIAKDLNNCFSLSEIDRRFPFPYALTTMTDTNPLSLQSQFFIWQPDQQKLQRFNLELPPTPLEKCWSGEDLKNLLIIPKQEGVEVSIDKRGATFLLKGKSKGIEISLNLTGESCLNIDFLSVECAIKKQVTATPKNVVVLPHFTNTLHPHEVRMFPRRTIGNCTKSIVVVPLHGNPDWVLGGKCTSLGIRFLTETTGEVTIKSVSVVPAHKIMPILSFPGNANQNILGYIALDQAHPSCKVSYDATKVNQAKNVILESAAPNQIFSSLNDMELESADPSVPNKRLAGLSGFATLTKSDFPEPGIYSLRLRAVGEDNKCVGVAGDNIVVTVR